MGQKPGTRPGWYPKIAGIYGCFLRFLSSDDAGMGQNQLGALAVEPGDPVGGDGGDLWAGHSRESWVFVGYLANCLGFVGYHPRTIRSIHLRSTWLTPWPIKVGIYARNADFKWQPYEMYLGQSLYWQCPWPPTRTESSPWIGWKSCGISSNKMTHGIKMDIYQTCTKKYCDCDGWGCTSSE